VSTATDPRTASARKPIPPWWRRGTLLGPAFVAAIAYVDPGNVASNVSAGAQFGYLLVWVLVTATVCAGVVQYLSAKLGVVTGKSLPELVGGRLKRRSRIAYWLQAEAVAMSTDLAEVLGGAVALYLLFELPLLLGGLIAGIVSLFLLLIQDRRGQRPFERAITGLLGIIAVGFVAGLFVDPPDPVAMAAGLVPRFDGVQSLLLATAMLGATVMPHVVYLHSALSRDRFGLVAPGVERRRLLAGTRTDVVLAMLVAGAVNISMLLLAASALQGQENVDTLEGAHAAVTTTLGPAVGLLFAIGLLVSGLASTSVGCYAGSVIMAGLLKRRISLITRRVVTMIPALVVLAFGADPTTVLVLSQVILSFGLPLALIPLVRLTSDRRVMGDDVNKGPLRIVGWVIAGLVSALNLALVAGALGAF
jgi:manganese transport protein